MTFKPALWFPIAVVLSAANFIAIWFAARSGEPMHATVHAVLVVAFGVWAHRLRRRPRGGEIQEVLDAVELETEALRRELAETQERLDFAERMLAERSDPLRVRRDSQ